MSSENGKKALEGEWVRIAGDQFDMSEDMIITFEGESCNITDGEGNPVYTFGIGDGRVTRNVLAGYRCYVMKAYVKFEKR